MMVMIGEKKEGKKEIIGLKVGVREREKRWREMIVEEKRGGMKIDKEIDVGEGEIGLWKEIEEVLEEKRNQRCWVKKTANIWNKVAL